MEDAKRWRLAIRIAVVIWVALVVRLMIADVWDETNGMLYFSASNPLAEKLKFVLTQSLGFWRPLATLIPAITLHFIPSFDVSWRIVRAINIVMLVGALAFFLDAAKRWSPSDKKHFLFTIAFLFSGSAIIAAGWYANVFDVSALLLIALGTSMLARDKPLIAGILFGLAFFAKETAILSLPFLLMLVASNKVSWRAALRAAIPAVILGAIYFAIRSRIVPFGSASDVHQFAADRFLPTIADFAESFWRQTLKSRSLLGYVWIVASFAALRRARLVIAAILFFFACVVIYWGMFSDYQNGVLIAHQNFIGRLYLIPTALMLFMLLIEEQTIALAVLLIPILLGGATTYRDHERFQRTYKRIYRTAREAKVKPLVVDYAAKPLDDKVRGIDIGHHPDAKVAIDPDSGKLVFR